MGPSKITALVFTIYTIIAEVEGDPKVENAVLPHQVGIIIIIRLCPPRPVLKGKAVRLAVVQQQRATLISTWMKSYSHLMLGRKRGNQSFKLCVLRNVRIINKNKKLTRKNRQDLWMGSL